MRSALWAGGGQIAVQMLGLVSGILIVRLLPPDQYAYYTVAGAALGMMTVLTDAGVLNGTLAQGGRVWQDRRRLGTTLATALALRRRLALFAAVLSLPLAVWLLRRQQASWLVSVAVAASVIPVFLPTITGQLLETVPRIHQRVASMQLIQVGANLARLGVVALAVWTWPIAIVASLSAAAPLWFANLRLRALAARDADPDAPVDPRVRSELVAQVKRTLPGSMYYAFSGQLSVWLVAVFGHAGALAAVGALGRLAVAFAALGAAFNLVAVPRFARLAADQPALVMRRFWQLQVLFAMVCCVPMLLLWLFPHEVLAVLGRDYHDLRAEVVLVGLSSIATLLTGAAFSLAAARGVVVPPSIAIPWCLAAQIALIAVLPVGTVAGAILVTLCSAIAQWLLIHVYFIWHTRTH